MACRLLAVFLLALASCEWRVDAVSLRDAGCTRLADCASDGGDVYADAGGPLAAPPRFDPSAGPAPFAALASALAGSWSGESQREGEIVRFTLEFEPEVGSGAHGSFRLRCASAVECDPFGPGSAQLDREGSYELAHVGVVDAGQGELRWSIGLARAVARFWAMREQDGTLAFELGHLSFSRELGTYAVVTLQREASAPGSERRQLLHQAACPRAERCGVVP